MFYTSTEYSIWKRTIMLILLQLRDDKRLLSPATWTKIYWKCHQNPKSFEESVSPTACLDDEAFPFWLTPPLELNSEWES